MRLCLVLLGALALAGCNRGDMAGSPAANASENAPVAMDDGPALQSMPPDMNAAEMPMDSNTSMDMNSASDPPPMNRTMSLDSNVMSSIENVIAPGDGPETNAMARSDGSEYCEVIQDRVSASECAYYREAWGRLETGRGALDLPDEGLVLNQQAMVSFALARPQSPGRPGSVGDPAEILDTAPEKAGNVRVGRRMAVRLSGEGFTIDPPGLVEKDLSAGGAARWDWRVTPTRGGRGRLTVSAYVIVQPPGGPRGESLIRTLSQPVEVAVTREQRARNVVEKSKSWLELLTGWLGALAAFIGVGIVGVVVAIRKLRKNKAERDAAGGGEDGDSP